MQWFLKKNRDNLQTCRVMGGIIITTFNVLQQFMVDCGCHQQKPEKSPVSHSGNSREEPLKYLPWSLPQMTSGKPEYCSLSKTVRRPNPAVKFDMPLPSSETALQPEQWSLVNKTTDGSAFPPPVDSPARLRISSDHHRRVCLSLDGN